MEITATQGSVSQAVAAEGNAFSALDGRAFLQLLVAQLKYQDPLSPMDNQQFMSEITQLTSLEKLQSIDGAMGSATRAGELGLAASLIGKEVTWTDAEGRSCAGVVDGVSAGPDGVDLHIGDQAVALHSVSHITASVPAASAAQQATSETP